MDKYIEKFMRYMEIEKNYSPHTLLNYKLDLNDFKKFCGQIDLEKIDYLLLRKYLAMLKEKNLGNRTVGRHLSALRLAKLLIPPIPEQRAIAAVLATVDTEIHSLEAKAAALERQKKGLMQKLLTGDIRCIDNQKGRRQ